MRAEFDDVELWEVPGATWLRTGGADTAALYGLIRRIETLGLVLLKVDAVDAGESDDPPPRSGPTGSGGQQPGASGGGSPSMDQITDQDQPVSHPMFPACASRIQAGPRGSRAGGPCRGRGGDASRVRASVVARPAGTPWRPGIPGIVHRRDRECSVCISRGCPLPRPWAC